jgi:succinyl-diaminopimelate desuccinylase
MPLKREARAKIAAYVQANRRELETWWIEMVTRLVHEPTVNVLKSRIGKFPYLKVPGEETRITNLLKPWARQMGLDYEVHALVPERESMIIHYGRGRGKRLFVPTHSDVVPPGEGWDSDPFRVKVDATRGVVVGRGVADNKGQMAAVLLTMKLLKDCGIELEGDFQAGIIADEEVQSEEGIDYGLKYLINQGLIKADFAVVPDIGGKMKTIDVAEKGRVVFVITAHGKQAHGSTPHLGINAINSMAEFLLRLKTHTFAHERHELLGTYTVNVGEITGGAAANIVPGTCQATIDMRLVPGMSIEGVKRGFLQLFAGLEARFELAVLSGTEPHQVDYRKSALVKVVQEVGASVRGETPHLIGMGGNTYAKHLFFGAGIEAIGYSAGDDEAMHQINEFASISEHVDLARAFAEIAIEMVG